MSRHHLHPQLQQGPIRHAHTPRLLDFVWPLFVASVPMFVAQTYLISLQHMHPALGTVICLPGVLAAAALGWLQPEYRLALSGLQQPIHLRTIVTGVLISGFSAVILVPLSILLLLPLA